MGAGGFHVRVRDGIGCCHSAMATRSSEPNTRFWAVCLRFWFWVQAGFVVWFCFALIAAVQDGCILSLSGD